jgi:hypothetical protein
MLIRAVFSLTATVYWWLSTRTPGNRLVAHVRAHPAWRWAPVSLMAGVACLAGSVLLSWAVQKGAPGWLNLGVLYLMWTGMKLSLLAPISLVWTVKARLSAWGARRAARAA